MTRRIISRCRRFVLVRAGFVVTSILAACLAGVAVARGEEIVKNAESARAVEPSASITVRPFAVALGEPLRVEVSVRVAEGQPLPTDAMLFWSAIRQELHGSVGVQFHGQLTVTIPIDLGGRMKEGTVTLQLSIPSLNEKVHASADVRPPAVAKELNRLSAALDLPSPCRIIFVGDSITAMNARANYVAIVERAIQAKYGDRITVINSGGGGDTMERVEERLESTVLNQKADWAFIYIGHNDCKIAWLPETGDFGECFCPLVRFEASYRRVIDRMRASGVKRISLISANAMYEPTLASAHEKAVGLGEAHNFWGRPDIVQSYNAVIRKLAGEYHLDFIDTYTPERTSPEWPQMFAEDGIHMAEAGDRVIAMEILRFLAAKGKAATATGAQ